MSSNEQEENTYPDDKTIDNDTLLYRRVMNQPNPPVRQIVWDGNKSCWRPSSVAFTDNRGSPMSIAIGDTLEKEGLEPDSVLIGHENFSLVSFPAKIPRDKKLGVIRKPIEEDLEQGVVADPAHGEVVGKKTNGVKRYLKDNAEWYIEPDLPEP